MLITLVIGKLPPRRDRDTNLGPLGIIVADISKVLGTDYRLSSRGYHDTLGLKSTVRVEPASV